MQTLAQGMRGFVYNADYSKIRDVWRFDSLKDYLKAGFTRAPSSSGHYVDMAESALQRINSSMATSIEYKAEGKGL